ncbi:helix-turn-helix domain-containing protein [Cohnella panacarvi]|uniref:helix-turn-helix domain-containing protein n=1 Tax=Cohnella panacarvi TaxID=400776 RepID=UPI00047EA65E|nr:helix-turn-helix domain-containing protein [Cohnella panacarvi]
MRTAELIEQAIDYIEEHLHEPIELDRIAEASRMSVPNLYRMFYAMTGHPVKEYIRKRRTSEAAFLLRQSELPANEIGYRLGFDAYQTFNNAFKRYTCLTPATYRQSEFIFSFERIRLLEQVSYIEDREVSERYSDVRVIRLAPQSGIGYLHLADSEEGIEDEAIRRFRNALAACDIDLGKMKLWGWNVDKDAVAPKFGYQLVATGDTASIPGHPRLRTVDVPGGLYAATWVAAQSGSAIVAAWNRMLSEWLPGSTFELGSHGFLEEFQQYNGRIVRLKLFLPVSRRQATETIDIVTRKEARTIRFRAEGPDCAKLADEAAVEWILKHNRVGDASFQLLMSCSYGNASEDEGYCEIYVSVPESFVPSEEDAPRMFQLEGGSYACVTTGAYGAMTGVLDRLYRWLGSSEDYMPDGKRAWFARYLPDRSADLEHTDFERAVGVECYVPVIVRHELKGA